MGITKLTATGIKSQVLDIEPQPVTLITGPNYSGKTAVKAALELLLLGYVPGLGKTNPAMFELSDGQAITASISVNNFPAISTSLQPSGKSIKFERNCDLKIPPVMLDLGSVFDLPKAKRLAYLFEMSGAGAELTWPKITAAIKASYDGEPCEASEEAIACVVGLADEAEGETIQLRMEAALKLLADQGRVTKAELKDLEGFARTQTRQADIDAPVAHAKRKVEEMEAELREAHDKAVEATRRVSEFVANRSTLENYKITLAKSLYEPMDTHDDENAQRTIADLEKKVAEANAEYSAVENFYQEAGGDGGIENYSRIANTANNACTKLEAEVAAKESQLTEILRSIGQTEIKRELWEEKLCCPTCGADGTDWREKLMEESAATIKGLKTTADDIGAELNSKSSAYNQLVKDVAAAQTVLDLLHSHKANRDEAQRKLSCLESEERRYREGDAARKQQQITAKHERELKVSRLEAQIEEVTARIGDTPEEEMVANADAALSHENEVSERHQAAKKEFTQEIANRSNELERQKSIARREVAEIESGVLKSSISAIQEIQREAMADSFGPLLKTVNRFTDGILKAPLDFHDGELGYWQGKTFVNHRTFSGTEEALAYTGFMIALAISSNATLRVAIIDEMARFDPVITRPKVVERMIELCEEGVLDNFFGIDSDSAFYDRYVGRENVLVHQMGGVA